MSRQGKEISKWRLMGAGVFSVTFRRVFVIALTVLSLSVWIVTVVGMGVLCQGSGLGGSVKPAEAAGLLLSPRETAAVIKWASRQEMSTAEDVAAAGGVLPAQWVSPSRNPFVPDRDQYPPRVKSDKTGSPLTQKREEADKRGRLDRSQLAPLRLEGTLALGKQKIAIVHGNSFDLEGRTMLLMLKEVQRQSRANAKAIVAKDVVTHFKVGDTIEVRPVTGVEGQVRISDEALALHVGEITSSSVTLTLGKQPYILRMKK